MKFERKIMNSGDVMNVFFNNETLKIGNDNMENVTLKWEFQCEDEYSITHYFRCTLIIEKC